MIAVYVLNLARSPERRAFMAAVCARAGVTPDFVAAVDGRACARAATSLSAAETALILSHRKAWRRLLTSGGAYAVVLEDDVHLGEGFAALLAADWSGFAFDAVKLETMFDPVWLARRARGVAGRKLRRLGAEHLGAAGYLVSRAGARKMLAMTRRLDEPVDHTLFGRETIGARRLVVYQLDPAVVVQDNLAPGAVGLATTLHEPDRAALAGRARAAKPRGVRRLLREAARAIAQARRAARLWPTMARVRTPFR